MKFQQDFQETKVHFLSWWKNEDIGRPMVKLVGVDGDPILPSTPPKDNQDLHIGAEFRFSLYEANTRNKTFFGETFPFMDANMGPGSMAAYLGDPPIFETDTVWYREVARESLLELGILHFDPDNSWWQEHLKQIKHLTALAKGTPFLPTIPDILENLDILSLLRSPQDLCYDLIDEPELVLDYIRQIDDLYFQYYDPMYEIVKDEDGGCCYTAFSIWAPDKCAKIQCDFSALMSPVQFENLVLDSLRKQTEEIPYTLYHLDGPDAIRHVDALMKLDKLNALQWTHGAAEVDAGNEKWFPLFDKVRAAGKGLWISIDQGDVDTLIDKSRKIVRRYGSNGIYIHYPELSLKDAEKLWREAERNFR